MYHVWVRFAPFCINSSFFLLLTTLSDQQETTYKAIRNTFNIQRLYVDIVWLIGSTFALHLSIGILSIFFVIVFVLFELSSCNFLEIKISPS